MVTKFYKKFIGYVRQVIMSWPMWVVIESAVLPLIYKTEWNALSSVEY